MTKKVPAYLVASSYMPKDHGDLTAYAEATHPLMEKYGGELIIAGSNTQFIDQFEGYWEEDARVTIFRFPSMEALQEFWHSEEYQAVKHLRTDAMAPNFTLAVNGFDPKEWDMDVREK